MTADDAAGTPASAEITGFAGKNEAADATGDADGVFQLPSTGDRVWNGDFAIRPSAENQVPRGCQSRFKTGTVGQHCFTSHDDLLRLWPVFTS